MKCLNLEFSVKLTGFLLSLMVAPLTIFFVGCRLTMSTMSFFPGLFLALRAAVPQAPHSAALYIAEIN